MQFVAIKFFSVWTKKKIGRLLLLTRFKEKIQWLSDISHVALCRHHFLNFRFLPLQFRFLTLIAPAGRLTEFTPQLPYSECSPLRSHDIRTCRRVHWPQGTHQANLCWILARYWLRAVVTALGCCPGDRIQTHSNPHTLVYILFMLPVQLFSLQRLEVWLHLGCRGQLQLLIAFHGIPKDFSWISGWLLLYIWALSFCFNFSYIPKKHEITCLCYAPQNLRNFTSLDGECLTGSSVMGMISA